MSQAIKRAIVMTAEYYGRQLSETVLEMYAEDLADLPADRVCVGYQQYRRNPTNKTFPLPAQIRELVAPEQFVAVETQAREIAARIMGAIPKFGWANPKEAQVFIGPEGWACVSRAGGWRYLCENTNARQAPMMQAQFRDQLEGSLRYGTHAVEKSIGALPSSEARGLESAGDILTRVLNAPKPPAPGGGEGQGA
jgi:hypothetical protein